MSNRGMGWPSPQQIKALFPPQCTSTNQSKPGNLKEGVAVISLSNRAYLLLTFVTLKNQ